MTTKTKENAITDTKSLWTWKKCRECGKKFRIPRSVNAREKVFYCSDSCRKKAARPFLEASNASLRALGEAVIRTACADYVTLREKQRSASLSEADRREILELQEFFSKRLDIFSPELDLSGEYLLQQLEVCDRTAPIRHDSGEDNFIDHFGEKVKSENPYNGIPSEYRRKMRVEKATGQESLRSRWANRR